MANTYELIVKTVDQSSRAISNIEKSLASLERRSQTVNTVLRGVGIAIAAVVGSRALGSVIEVTSRFEDLRSTLSTVTGSAKAGADAFSFVQRFAANTAFSVEDLTETYIKLRTSGITPTEKLLRTFSDAASVTTDRVGSLQAITDLLSRTTAGGLGLEDLNRLADRGIPVFDILQDKLGLTRLEISKFGQTAEGATQIVNALLEGLNERFGGATETSLNNLSVLTSNLGESINTALAAFGEGLAPALKEVIRELTAFINGNEGFFNQLGQLAGDALTGIANGIKSLAGTLGLIDPGGLQRALATVLDGFASLAEGVAISVDALVNGVKAGAVLIQQAVVAVSRLLSTIPGIDFEFKIGLEGESLEGTIDRLAREARSADIALSNAIDTNLIIKQEQKLRDMERLIAGLRLEFSDEQLLADPGFQDLGQQVMRQRNIIEQMYKDRSIFIQRIVDEESQKIRDSIDAGELLIITPFSQTPSGVLAATQPTVDAIRQRASEIRTAAEETARIIAIQEEFPLYDDAILRNARGYGILSDAASNAAAALTPFQSVLATVDGQIGTNNAKVAELTAILREASAAFANGSINAQQYAAVIANVGNAASGAGANLQTLETVLANAITTGQQNAQTQELNAEALAYVNANSEKLGLTGEALKQTQIALGMEFKTVSASAGGAAEAIETVTSTYERSIKAIKDYELNNKNVSGAMQRLESDFTSGKITLEQFRVGMEGMGAGMENIQNQSIAMGLTLTEAFASAGDGLARGLARGIVQGEGILESFKNFMSSIFEEILYQIIQQAFIKPLVASLTSGLSSAFGAFASGGAGAFAGGLFGGGGLFSFFGSLLGGIFGFANGGIVPGLSTSGDSVPAMLTPGEVVLNKGQQAALLNDGVNTGEPITVNFNINAIDTRSGTEFILNNRSQITSVIQQAYNSRGRQGPLG